MVILRKIFRVMILDSMRRGNVRFDRLRALRSMPPAEQQFEESVRENVPLAPMTTIGIGGPARYFADVSSTEALQAGVDWARGRNLPLLVLGGGSNLVV